MSPKIVFSLIVIFGFLVGGYAFYKRAMKRMAPDTEPRQVNGARLTSERLHQLPSPPWRFVHELNESALSGVDHVVVGPAGVFGVVTVMTDRPAPTDTPAANLVAAAAIPRGAVNELAQRAGLTSDKLLKVFWGAPNPEQPAGVELMHGTIGIEGQRLAEWLQALPPGPLTTAQVDLAWQAVTTGVGRPDPLA